ncbi:MAG: hypothetical protein ACKO4V_08940, partial [Planctomycetota bacterium]
RTRPAGDASCARGRWHARGGRSQPCGEPNRDPRVGCGMPVPGEFSSLRTRGASRVEQARAV